MRERNDQDVDGAYSLERRLPEKAGRLLLALLSAGMSRFARLCPKVPVCRAIVSALA